MRLPERCCGASKTLEGWCGEPSVLHWITAEGFEGGPCEEHRHVAPVEPYVILMQHAIGPNCGMPGSIFDLEENVCRYEEDELGIASLVGDLEEKVLELVG